MDKLYVAKVVSSTSVDGVGLRNSLYVAGCPIHCKGCHNSQLWDIKSGTLMTVQEVFDQLNSDSMNISILGGEPMMQYDAVLELCRMIKERYPKKTIWLWTGFIMPVIELFYGSILKYVDVVVDGPFVERFADPNLLWRGSSNQQIYKIQHNKKNYEIIAVENYNEL